MKPTYKNIHQAAIERIKKGDKEAQLKVYKLYYKAMFNTSFRIVNNREDAEDIMQESFLKAFHSINQFSNEVSFGAWLKRIVINQSLDYLKKQNVHFESIDTQFELSEATEETTCVDIDVIKEAIQQLPDKYRVVFSLNLLEGYDHNEISSILNISYANSRTLFSRAKDQLKQKLQYNQLIV